MKKIFTLLLFAFSVSANAQQANKLLQAQSKPYIQSNPNGNVLAVDTTDFKIWAYNLDSLKLKVWNMIWVLDSIKNLAQSLGDVRYAQLLGAYPNPAFVNSLSASKVFGLSTVATTGAYADLSGLPNLSLYYLASNPNGYISGITSGMISAALGFSPYNGTANPLGFLTSITGSQVNTALGYTAQAQLNGTGFVKASGTTISYDNTSYATAARTLTINGTALDLSANRSWSVGDLLSSGSYANPPWLTSMAWSKITGTPTSLSGYGIADPIVLTSGSYSNPSWITGLSWSKISSNPTTLAGYGITDGVTNSSLTTTLGSYATSASLTSGLAGKENSIIAGTTSQYWRGDKSWQTLNTSVVPESGSLYYTDSRARSAISLTTTGSGAATYNSTTGVLNIPISSGGTVTSVGMSSSDFSISGSPVTTSGSITANLNTSGVTAGTYNGSYTVNNKGIVTAATNASFNNSPTVTLNTSKQISTTNNARVSYSVTHSIALTVVVLAGASQAYLEISPNNSTWTTISQSGYSDGVGVGLSLVKTTTGNIQGEVPAGYYVRIRTVTSGGGSAAFTSGQEVTY